MRFFYWVLSAFSAGLLTGYSPVFEVSGDFNMAEKKRIESKLKKCFILAV